MTRPAQAAASQGIPGAGPHLARIALCSAGELWGGVEQFIVTFARALACRGVRTDVYVFANGPLRVRLESSLVPVHVSPVRGRYNPASVFWLGRELSRSGAQVLHTHGYKAGVIGGLAGVVCRAPVVHTIHGLVESIARQDHLKMMLNFKLERGMAGLVASHTVAVSRGLFDHLHLAAFGDRASVIHNGLEPFVASPPVDPIQLPQGTAAGFRLGIVGRIAPVKGHATLLKAMARSEAPQTLHLYVFGEGPSEPSCRELVASLHLGDRVHFMGFKEDIHRWVAALDAVAMPSLYEGLPYTLLEAFYLGVPVLCSAVGGLAELVIDGQTGLLAKPGDDADWARVLRMAAADPVLLRNIREQAHARLMADFLIDRTVEEYLAVFRRVLAR